MAKNKPDRRKRVHDIIVRSRIVDEHLDYDGLRQLVDEIIVLLGEYDRKDRDTAQVDRDVRAQAERVAAQLGSAVKAFGSHRRRTSLGHRLVESYGQLRRSRHLDEILEQDLHGLKRVRAMLTAIVYRDRDDTKSTRGRPRANRALDELIEEIDDQFTEASGKGLSYSKTVGGLIEVVIALVKIAEPQLSDDEARTHIIAAIRRKRRRNQSVRRKGRRKNTG